MAASTMTRTGVTLVNDTGTPSAPVGDGTLLNNAWVQTFMDRIDALFTGALTIGGVFTAEAFGSHTFSASGTGSNAVVVRNPTAGTSNAGALHVGNDSSATRGLVRMHSTTYTSSGASIADGLLVQSSGVGGVTVNASDAAGTVSLYTGGVSTYPALRAQTTGRVDVMPGCGAGDAALGVGYGRSASGYAYLDLCGAQFETYGLRLMRGYFEGVNSSSWITHSGTGTLIIEAEDSGGEVDFRHLGSTKLTIGENNITVGASAWLTLTETDANVTMPYLTANTQVALYRYNDKFVIAYNNGSAANYVWIALDGSDTTWTHSTTAP